MGQVKLNRPLHAQLIPGRLQAEAVMRHWFDDEQCINGSNLPILLKNSIIWMGEFPVENQINLSFTYLYVREFSSDIVRTDHD